MRIYRRAETAKCSSNISLRTFFTPCVATSAKSIRALILVPYSLSLGIHKTATRLSQKEKCKRAHIQQRQPRVLRHGYRMQSSALGPVAQWIRHRPTEPGIAGSSPAGVICHQYGSSDAWQARRACFSTDFKRGPCLSHKSMSTYLNSNSFY